MVSVDVKYHVYLLTYVVTGYSKSEALHAFYRPYGYLHSDYKVGQEKVVFEMIRAIPNDLFGSV